MIILFLKNGLKKSFLKMKNSSMKSSMEKGKKNFKRLLFLL